MSAINESNFDKNDIIPIKSEHYIKVTARKRILLELFDELPDSEAENLIKNLEEKRRYYSTLYEELKRRHKK